MSDNPFKDYTDWLLDGNRNSEIPDKENLTKYNSPISQPFALRMFIKNPKICLFLDEYFNNYYVFSMKKEDLFKFLKMCVVDFGFSKYEIPYVKRDKTKDKVKDAVAKKFPTLKYFEVETLTSIIEKSKDKDDFYMYLGLKTDSSKRKTTKKQQEEIKKFIENSSKESNKQSENTNIQDKDEALLTDDFDLDFVNIMEPSSKNDLKTFLKNFRTEEVI